MTVILVLASLLAASGCQPAKDGSATPGVRDGGVDAVWNNDRRREWAAHLRADGLDDQALAVYEEILRDGRGLSESVIAGTSLVVAEIHLAKGRYEEALRSLYRARIFELSGDLKQKVESKTILCFERLGRGSVADRLLDKATDPSDRKAGATAGDEVLAKIGSEELTRAELDSVIAASPPELKARLENRAQRLELLRTIVAQRVLVRKAEKLQLDQDPSVRLAVAAATREILVRKLMADELADDVAVNEADAKLYYEAHRDRFREPGELLVAHIAVPDAQAEALVRDALARGEPFERLASTHSTDAATSGKGGRIEQRLVEGQYHDTFVNVAEVFATVGETPVGQVVPASVKTARERHVIKVLERKPGVQHSFDEAGDTARRLLAAEREQAAVRALLDQALGSADVELFEDKL